MYARLRHVRLAATAAPCMELATRGAHAAYTLIAYLCSLRLHCCFGNDHCVAFHARSCSPCVYTRRWSADSSSPAAMRRRMRSQLFACSTARNIFFGFDGNTLLAFGHQMTHLLPRSCCATTSIALSQRQRRSSTLTLFF